MKFKNPLCTDFLQPDPCVIYDNNTEYYYALWTRRNDVVIYRSRNVATILSDNDSLEVWHTNAEDGIFECIWAPEMHKCADGHWYIYTSGTYRPEGGEKRLFVLKSNTHDPFDGFTFVHKLDDDLYAIDPTVYTDQNGQQYICYSVVIEGRQLLEIREMTDPVTFGEKRAIISRACYDWEMIPPFDEKSSINEGAFFVKNEEKLFIIYSANGTFQNEYCLGVLEYLGGEMCCKDNWKKQDKPLLVQGNGIYGPGHATFFRSPDKKELWCAYHGMTICNDEKKEVVKRHLNLQKVHFDQNGLPVMGKCIGINAEIDPPSGE